MSSLQPPPLPLLKMVGATIGLWLQDTWNKLKNFQTQSNTALYVSGMKLSNATPDGSDISWSSCTVYYQGAAYPIKAGNTTGGALLVRWVVGSSTFSSGNSYTPGPTVFAIATNNQGTADITWNKVGANSIQASQVIGGRLPPSYQPQTASLDFSGASPIGGVTVLSYTGAAALLTIFYEIDPVSGYATNAGFGTTLTITLDGQATTYTITTSNQGGTGGDDSYNIQPFANLINGTGADKTPVVLGFYLTFTQSLQVVVSNTNQYNGGVLHVKVGYAKKTMSQQTIQDGGHTYVVTYDDATGEEISRVADDPGPPVRPVPLTKLGYRNLFTLAERIAIDNYATNANLTADQKATLTSLHYDFQLAEDIDLSDPQLIAGTQLLEQYGLIARDRAAQILANQSPPT